MTSSTPISPPLPDTTASIASTTAPEPPLSPITSTSRSSTFEHKTSGSVPPSTTHISTDTPAINDAPVELDGSGFIDGGISSGGRTSGKEVSPGLGEADGIDAEFLGEGDLGVGSELREKRKALLQNRSKDPGVIVDVPQEPTAEEVLAAKSAEGVITPGVVPELDGGR